LSAIGISTSFQIFARRIISLLLNYQENSSVKYVLLVSHGTIAPAMHETANAFFLGEREDLLHANVAEGMGLEEYTENVKKVLSVVGPKDGLIVIADLLGGSPLTYASYAINEMGLLKHTTFLTGMNLPLVIDVLTRKDDVNHEFIGDEMVCEIRDSIGPFFLPKAEAVTSSEEDI
jgi:PTS system N-acetylgalactosamine-specific IIA component